MTTETTGTRVSDPSVGAAPHEASDWHQINWRQVERNVRRLQTRIAQATQQGKWNRVKALQHLLTHSLSGKALAVRRVTENTGKRTAGVDGLTWNTPEQKASAIRTMRQREYHPQPLRRVYIPKSNGKQRPLGIPTMRDRAMQALYLLALAPIAEVTADPNSYGFRTARSTADAIEACFIALCRNNRAQWILEGDIRACFDQISHEWLEAHIPLDKAILRKWLKAGYLEDRRFHVTEEGTPQGGIISPVLANMALDGLERLLASHYSKTSKAGKKAKVNFVRYADDFIVTGSSQELLEQEVKPLVEQFMRERGLELSPEKTVITHIEQGFDAPMPDDTQIPQRKTHQVLHHSLEEERQGVSPQGANAHQAKPGPDRRRTDRGPESSDSRMELVSPPCGEQSHFSRRRSRHLPGDLVMGSAQTPPQNALVDQGQVLPQHRPEPLGVHRRSQGRKRADQSSPALGGFIGPH